MIAIDGISYQVPLVSLVRKAEFLDKYASRTEDGVLHRELIGVYYNYELKLGRAAQKEYSRLWDVLTAPQEFHTVRVPACGADYTFQAYFSGVRDELLREYQGDYYWTGLTVNFIARSPAKR